MKWPKFFTRSAVKVSDSSALSFFGGRPSLAGVQVNENTALSHSAFYRGIDLISDRIAGLDFNVYRRSEDGKEKAKYHPAYKLLRHQANEYQSAHTIKKTVQKDRLIHGNGYLWIQRDETAKPISLYRLDPLQTFPVVEGGSLVYATVINGERMKLMPYEVFHLRGLGDSIVGYSLIDLMKDMIGSHVATQRHTAVFFKNGARPTYAVKMPAGLSPEDQKQFREDWNNVHSASADHMKAALLPFGFDIDTYGFSPDELTLLELKQFSLVDFANLIGIPASYLNANINTSHSSLEAEAKSFLANSLNGHLQAWEAEANLKFLSERHKQDDSHFFEFDRKQLESTDIEKLSKALNTQLLSGAIHFNEYRRAINLPPIKAEWAEEHIMPVNLAFIEQVREKTAKEIQNLDKPEPAPQAPVQPVQTLDSTSEPEAPAPEARSEAVQKLDSLTRSVCDRMASRVTKAIKDKGQHDLRERHLAIITDNLTPICERAEDIAGEWLDEIQEELNHALPEQVQPKGENLYAKLQ